MFRQHTLEITRLYCSDNQCLAGYQVHRLDRQKNGSRRDDTNTGPFLSFRQFFITLIAGYLCSSKIRNVGNFMVCRSYTPRGWKGTTSIAILADIGATYRWSVYFLVFSGQLIPQHDIRFSHWRIPQVVNLKRLISDSEGYREKNNKKIYIYTYIYICLYNGPMAWGKS